MGGMRWQASYVVRDSCGLITETARDGLREPPEAPTDAATGRSVPGPVLTRLSSVLQDPGRQSCANGKKSGKNDWGRQKIQPAQDEAGQLKGEECPSQCRNGLRHRLRHAAKVPCQESR